MRIAAAQMDVHLGCVNENTEKILGWIQKAVEQNVDLVVFPECALTGYCFQSRDEAWPHARTLEDPLWMEIANACAAKLDQHESKEAKHPLFAVVGFLLRDGERLFNATALVGPAGIVAHYRKVHLPHLGIDRFVDRGDVAYQVHEAGKMRVGLAICYDCSFPEPMRVLGLEGADVIALATNWPMAAKRTAEIVPAARSMENHLYFVACNRIGRERDFGFCGLSTICGPDGIELARASEDTEQLLIADVDLAVARNKRIERTPGAHVIDRFADRQPEFYGRIQQPKT
jgi:predicted amidohydrolase